jgi:gamma-glutamyltranspeptidase/glutathione hydrolase
MKAVQSARSRSAMVVSGHRPASEAALQVLSSGGTVVDAAVAGAAVLAVTQPQACTLGGDAFVLVHDASSGRTEGLNASGPAPRLARRELFPSGIPQRGAMSVTVPGVVAGWQSLHGRFGKLPWPRLFEPAIALARDGVPMSRGVARATHVYAELLAATPAARALFPPAKDNDRLVQPALAHTLQAVASGGAKAFYEGAIAQCLARACEAEGGLLRANDFLGYEPEWVSPIEVAYRGHTVRAMPPNSYGLYLLLQLLALEHEALSREALDSPKRIAALVGAARAAFRAGNRAVADPRAKPEPFGPLLVAEERSRLREATEARMPNRGGTAVISVADAAGNAVTLVQSIFLVFGSGVVDAETGVVLNNRMLGFSAEAGHPNEAGPGKRPAHTLCPCMAFDGGGAYRYGVGTPGGPGQTITISQVLQAALDAGVSLDEAIAAPRWSQDLGSQAVVEDSMPDATIEGARALGVALEKAQPNSPFFGSAEAIQRLADGSFLGVADYRRDAWACGA